MGYKDISKGHFQTGDKPTQAQFYTMLDNLRWKDETYDMNDVTGLVAALLAKVNTADYEGQLIETDTSLSYTKPGGYLLEKIIPFYGVAGSMQISKVVMGDTDEADIAEVDAGWNRPIQLDIFSEDDLDIYFDGIPAGSKIIILKRKINFE